MIIGFDLTWISKENQYGGVFQCAIRLVQALTNYSDNRVIAIVNVDCEPLFDHLSEAANFRQVTLSSFSSLSSIIEQERIEVIHTPLQIFPNITLSVPMISTLHDLQPFHLPEFFTPEEIEFRNIFYRKAAEFGERVIVSFQHVKEDIVRFYNISAEKIDVCTMGMPELLPATSGQFEVIKQKYNLPEKYLFYSANTWRHKNHIGLIRGVKLLHDKYGIKIPLICTGFKYPDYFPQIETAISDLGLTDSVRFLGYLPEEEMPIILSGATLAVIPTLYEAGSYPLMEAMVQGVPVICSSTTSLPDTIGDLRFVFDPNSPDEMAEKMALLLSDEQLRMENIANSDAKVQEASWVRGIKKFEESYCRAIEGFAEKKESRFFYDWTGNYEFMVNKKLEPLLNEITHLHAQVANLELERASYNEIASGFTNLKSAIYSSLSWRITKPLRILGDWVRRCLK